jgi:hypothetical protein
MGIGFAPNWDDIEQLPPRKRAKYGRERRFYSANGEKSYIGYVDEGSKNKIDYVAYSGDGEKSGGVFDKSGLLTKQRQTLMKQKLRETGSVIWHGYISFTTEFGDKYLREQEDAVRLMRTEFPRFFKSAGLNPDNVTWYAGLHENTLHKHIHFSFFENEPMRFTQRDVNNMRYSEGHIPSRVIARFKVDVERRLTDAAAEIREARQRVTDLARDVLFSGEHGRRMTKEIQEQLAVLSALLPKDGRLSYASENMAPLRAKINGIADLIIKQNRRLYDAFNVLINAAVSRDERTKQIFEAQKTDKRYWNKELTADKIAEDMYRRLGNYVINTALRFQGKVKPVKSRGAAKRMKKQSVAALMTHCVSMGAYAEREAMDFFREYMAKLKEEEFKNRKQEDKEQSRNEIEID